MTRRTTAGKLAALMAPYRGAVPTVDPTRDRGALSARIAATAAGMSVSEHRAHCRAIVHGHNVTAVMDAHRGELAAAIRADRLAAGGAR